jgi:hypothetical protein
MPKCSDGIDNDGDGKIDYPNDPGCSAPNVDDEADDCPDGSNCPQCANGKDDDANAKTDFPDDPGCTSAADPDEYTMNPVACGTNVMIRQLPVTGMVMGTFDATTTTFSQVSPCGGGDASGVQVFAYELHLTEPKVIVASTMGSAIDTVLDIRSADCQAATSELACNDNDQGQFSKVVYSAQPGLYYILVENKVSTATGDFKLEVQQLAGEGTECTDTSECGPGLLCRIPAGGSTMSCEKPVCDDGRDDDGDGKMDYPNDPGCDAPDDADEMDDCPSGPNCPACGNGVDDDNDGQTDFPNDTACTSASGPSEAACPNDMDNYGAITGPVSMGDLSMAHHDFTASCQSSTGNDASFILDLPVDVASLTIDTNGSGLDSVVTLWQGTCATEIECDDDDGDGTQSLITRTNVTAGTYAITVAGYSSGNNGPFTLNVHGTLAENASCENTLNGILACEPGTTCAGTMGSRTCMPAACRDGVDNDGDGKIDYPLDPGCANANDDDETDDCPTGPNCPVCSNGVDDDTDGQIDYPNDPSCTSAGSVSEACTTLDPVTALVTPTLTGTTIGAANDFIPSCGSTSTTTAPDQVYQVTVPALTHLTIDADTDFDAAISLLGSTCGGTSLQCNDFPENVDIGPLAAGTYYYVVDGWSSGSGTYTLTVSGTIAAGESCEGPLATSGALTCESGTTCAGTMGSRTCVPPACADGIDNDGDGLIDNFDTGCDSATDADETDPATPPVCANTMDDDSDGATDFPADIGCARAGGSTEAFCPAETDALVLVTAPTTTVDLTNSSHTTTLACQSNTGHDWTLGLSLPVKVASLTIDTEGSTATDTVVELLDPQCTASIECDDDDGTGNLSTMTLANVAAGNYAIVVACWGGSTNAPANVNVHGTLAAGTRCDSALVTSGVLACDAGLTCTGTPATCQ